jgi:hypothetical protein
VTASDNPCPDSCPTTEEPETLEQASEPAWLPDDAAIVSEETFTSPQGRQYRILRTNLTDEYDDPAEGTAERGDPDAAPPNNDDGASS